MKKLFGPMMGALALTAAPLQAAVDIPILNGDMESPSLLDGINNSFDGIHGPGGVVPGWTSNLPSNGGVNHISWWFPESTNVMYLHGDATQNFHTAGYDLGVDLQSNTTYTLTFDVLRWVGVTLDDYVTFRAGIYTGADYDSRSALAEVSGDLELLDGANQPVNSKTITLTFATTDVAPGTKFWIGGDAFGNASDHHRAHYDNFALTAEAIPEPSSVMLLGAAGFGALVWLRKRKAGACA